MDETSTPSSVPQASIVSDDVTTLQRQQQENAIYCHVTGLGVGVSIKLLSLVDLDVSFDHRGLYFCYL